MKKIIAASLWLSVLLPYVGQAWETTELYKLVESGAPETLLEHPEIRKNVDWVDAQGRTALMYAAEVGRVDMLEALLAFRADVEMRDSYGQTAIFYAAIFSAFSEKGLREETVPFLVAAGADIDARDSEGQTPLHVTAKLHDIRAVRALIEAGADTELRNARGQSVAELFFPETRHADLLCARFLKEPRYGEMEPESPPEPKPLKTLSRSDVLLEGVSLPLTLVSSMPSEEAMEWIREEFDDDPIPRLYVTVLDGPAGAAEEGEGCPQVREKLAASWDESQKSIAYLIGGPDLYKLWMPGLRPLRIEIEADLDLYSTHPIDQSPFCLMGYGEGTMEGVRIQALHLRRENEDLAIILFKSKIPDEMRESFLIGSEYPLSRPDPIGLLVVVNAAGVMPFVLVEE